MPDHVGRNERVVNSDLVVKEESQFLNNQIPSSQKDSRIMQ